MRGVSLKKVVDAKVAGWQNDLREHLRAGFFVDVINTDAIPSETELPLIARQFGAHFELDNHAKVAKIRFPR